MHYILGTLALLGVGLIALLIETHKQDKQYITNLEAENDGLIAEQQLLHDDIKFLQANQKPVPWNKGKKGYKLTRKSKTHEVEYTSSSNDGHILFTPSID